MDAREFVELLDKLTVLRSSQTSMIDQNIDFDSGALNEEIEVVKRQLTDYLLETDPRKGVYVKGEHP